MLNGWITSSAIAYNSYTYLDVAIDTFSYENPDALVIVGAGNNGESLPRSLPVGLFRSGLQ